MAARTSVDTPSDRSSSEDYRRVAQTAPNGRASSVSETRRPEGSGGEAAALGTSRIEFPPLLTDPQEWRRLRFARRQRSSSWLIGAARADEGLPKDAEGEVRAGDPAWVRPPRPARCRWRVAEAVSVHGGGGPAHFSGTERCASIWACPVCSAVIRGNRADDIQEAARIWQEERKGTILFLTLTLRHQSSDALADTLDAVLKGWKGLISGAPWLRQRARLGISGYVRSVEVTWGEENGWHPHAHALLFLDEAPSTDAVSDFESWIHGRWTEQCRKVGAGLPSKLRGVDLRVAGSDGLVVAQYLAKTQEEARKVTSKDRIGAEMARFDLKNGRSGRVMPFQLLDANADDRRAFALWIEYFKATKGRRAITWARGFRDELGLGLEKSEQEIVDEAEKSELLFSILGYLWDEIRTDHIRMAAILEAVEFGNIEAAQQLSTGRLMSHEREWVDMLTGEICPPYCQRVVDKSHAVNISLTA